jgi:hypothetical protein
VKIAIVYSKVDVMTKNKDNSGELERTHSPSSWVEHAPMTVNLASQGKCTKPEAVINAQRS